MNTTEFLSRCWRYYLMLESDFSHQRRYITFEEDNFSVYSLELSKQYLSICSEIDIICKQYCKHLNPEESVDTIEKYANIILSQDQEITGSKISLKESPNLVMRPWNDWQLRTLDSATQSVVTDYKSPEWWTLYNKVKHQRLDINSRQPGSDLYYKSANLKNVMSALSGLFALEMHFYKSLVLRESVHPITIPPDNSTLFTLVDWETQFIAAGSGIIYQKI